MARILVIEDSTLDYELVQNALGFEHQLAWAKDINEARKYATSQRFDLFIVDIMLPEGSGLEFCSFLRSQSETHQSPIIILSLKSTSGDKVMGLNLGADDYLTKPFNKMELQARVNRKLQSSSQIKEQTNTKVLGPLSLQLESAKAFFESNHGDRTDLSLTPVEFRILWALTRHDGILLSRDQLADAAYGESHFVTPRTIDSHVRSLRKKLGNLAQFVETVYGSGYRFNQAQLKSAS